MSSSRNLKRRGVHKLYKNSGEIKKVFIPHTTIIGTNKDPKTLKVKNDLIVTGSAYISGTLNVYSGSNFTYNTLTIESNSGETDYGLHIKRDSGSSAFMIKLENEDASATDASMFGIFHQDTGDFSIGESYDDYKFHIDGDNDGHIGIGTNSPAGMLHLEADMSAVSSQPLIFLIRHDTSITDGEELGAVCFGGTLDGTTYNNNSIVIRALAEGTWASSDHGSCLQFMTTADGSTSTYTRMTIKGSGLVGIGTTAPEGVLHIAGTGTDLSGVPGLMLNGFSDAELDIAVETGETMQFGEWDGTTATLNAKIAADGAFYTNDGSVSSLSDKRVKKNIQDLDGCLSSILSLRPVSFEYNGKGQIRDTGDTKFGFVAQEVEKVLPDIVGIDLRDESGTKVEYRSMSQTNLISYLVGAIQELEKKVSDLEEQLTP